jgi:hypothetical protein
MRSLLWRTVKVLTLGAGLVGLVGALACAGLLRLQQRPPHLRATADVARREGDREAIDRVAALPRVGIVALPGRLGLDLADGADLLELFAVLDSTRFAALEHESPVVRAYSAFHLVRTAPESIARLRPLLGDHDRVSVGAFDDTPAQRSVGDVVVDLLCAKASDSETAKAFLAAASTDWHLLAVRGRIKDCLTTLARR